MAKGYKVVLKAHQYMSGPHHFIKPFETVIPEESKELSIFINNPAFDVTQVIMADTSVDITSDGVSLGDVTGLLLKDIEGIPSNISSKLIKAGYNTAEDILSDNTEYEELISIKGISDKTADMVIAECEKALGVQEEDVEE